MFAGTSASVAVTVKAKAANSFVVLLPGFVTTGATFTSLTVIVIAAVPDSAGEPLSVTRMVIGKLTPGPALRSASS